MKELMNMSVRENYIIDRSKTIRVIWQVEYIAYYLCCEIEGE